MRELKRALVVDDDFLMRAKVSKALEQAGLDVTFADCKDAAARALSVGDFNLVFWGMGMAPSVAPLENGEAPLEVIMASFADLDEAIKRVTSGLAFDYLIKPFSEEQVGIAISRAREIVALRQQAGLPAEDEAPIQQRGEPVGVLECNLEELEKQTIIRVMNETGGSRNVMAEKLGISVRTLRNKLNKYRAEDLLEIPSEA